MPQHLQMLFVIYAAAAGHALCRTAQAVAALLAWDFRAELEKMSRYNDDMGQRFEERASRLERGEEWKAKGLRFLRYLSTRQVEVWGFFAAGFILGKIF